MKESPLLQRLKDRAARLKTETYALYLAARHPCTPWYARLLVAGIVAYALSPIDLIPDFIPVVGYLDDLVLLPIAIALAIRMIPTAVMAECRLRADEVFREGSPVSWAAGALVVAVWLFLGSLLALWVVDFSR